MSFNKHLIIGLHITDRVKHASLVQQLLTNHGCSIKTRLGLHDADDNFCFPNGLLLLEIIGKEESFHRLADELNEIDGVEAKTMVFDHP